MARCPCVKANATCSRACRCKNCGNKPPIKRSAEHFFPAAGVFIQCSCHNSPTSSKDTLRKSRCPCLLHGVSCSITCKCKNCGNITEASRNEVHSDSISAKKRKRENSNVYKRSKGSSYLAKEGFDISIGPWTELETMTLIVLQDVLQCSNLLVDVSNVTRLYQYLASSDSVLEMKLEIGKKRSAQIAAKLLHLRGKQDIYIRLADIEMQAK